MTTISAEVTIDGVSVAYQRGEDVVHDVTLHIDSGDVVALLGPSGSGKTSLLRAIAGLERPTAGTVSVGGQTLSGPGTWVKPEGRSIGMVFQDGALFPHLSVGDNIAFGLRGLDRHAAHRRVDELLDMVDLAGFAARLPATLSGGQQQRVALARSLAAEPSVLLLDEPFSALDAALRVQVRAQVSSILRDVGVTTIFVTHDQDEAFVLGDRVAVLREGRMEQVGTPAEIYRTPSSPWVAAFVGEANLVHGRVDDEGRATTPFGAVRLDREVPSGAATVLIRPEDVVLHADGDAAVESVEYYGHDVRYTVRLRGGEIVAVRVQGGELFKRGDAVTITATDVRTVAWPDADAARAMPSGVPG